LFDGQIGGQHGGGAKDQAERNAKFHSFSNRGMPWGAASFQACGIRPRFYDDAFQVFSV
jgi:hypothetical protein